MFLIGQLSLIIGYMASAATKTGETTDPATVGLQPGVWLAAIGMVAAMAMFAGNFVLGRRAILVGIDAFDLVALRYGVAGSVFLPVLLTRLRPISTLGKLGWRRGCTLTVLGGAPYFLAAVGALSFAPAGHGVVLNPGTVTLAALAMAAMQGDRLGRWAMAGVPLMLVGLVLVAGDGLAGRPDAPLAWIGDILLIGSGVAWAAYGVLMRRWALDGLTATAVVSVLSLVWLPPYVLLAGMAAAVVGMSLSAIRASMTRNGR